MTHMDKRWKTYIEMKNTFTLDKRMLDKTLQVPEDMLKELISLYRMFWVGKYLCCPKHDNRVVGVKEQSLLDDSSVYLLSKEFLIIEYRRTGLKILKNIMTTCKDFYSFLANMDKERKDFIKSLLKTNRKYIHFTEESDIDDGAFLYLQ